MTWTKTIEWQGYRLTLNREASKSQTTSPSSLPPAPGAGEIRFPALFLYSNGEALHLEAEITGSKIARIYMDGYFETEDGWLAGPVCRRDLKAPNSKEIGGVEIPLWAKTNKLSAAWPPAVHLLINPDDKAAAWAFVQPSQSNPNEQSLHAKWISDKQEYPVRLTFSPDGTFTRMALLGGDMPRGARGLTPQTGDKIIPTVHWLQQDGDTWLSATGSTNPIFISGQLPRLETIPAPPGRCQIGLLAYDLDGNMYRGLVKAEIPDAWLDNR